VILAVYGPAAERLLAACPGAALDEVADDWADRWRAFHRGVRLGPLWVGPPWEAAPAGALPVVIDPGRAFGTGAHPTTRLCLELLLEQPPGALVDVGCGSGVLAIAAAKLGHGPVVALDVDPAAVAATAANAERNGVRLDVRLVAPAGEERWSGELALANIAPEVVRPLARRLDVERVVASGHLAGDALELDGFRRAGRRERDGWAAELFVRG